MYYNGIKVITNEKMTERVLHARSPARAARRMKKGYPQHHITRPRQEFLYHKAQGVMVMHPVLWDRLKTDVPQVHSNLLNPFHPH